MGAPEAKSAPKEAPEAVRSLHAYDDPKIGPKEPRKAPVKREPKPEKKEKKVGTQRPSAGRKNNSGLVRVGNITKAVGYNLGNGTAVLRDAGIEIVKDPVTGTPCVRIQDKDAARELLARQAHPEEKVPTSDEILKKALKKQKEVVVPPGVVKVPIKGFEDVLVHSVNPPKPAKLPEVEIKPLDAAPVISAEEAAMLESLIQPVEIDLQPASDEALGAELRRRGWTVTCTKSI